jgi:iron complex outermembrane receptor protein
MNQNHFRQMTLSFKHWTRKKFAIFNSLKVQVRIAGLAVALLQLLFVPQMKAQTSNVQPQSNEYDLDTVEVVGELTPVMSRELARMVQVISVPELQKTPTRDLFDALGSQSSLDLRLRGKSDIQADLSLHGSTFDQVQILYDGFDLSDPQTGHHSLNLPLHLSQIQQIEFLNGPATRVLGANAYAGTVNFQGPSPQGNALEVGLVASDFGTFDAHFSISLKSKKFTHFLSASGAQSKGYTSNTDFKKWGLFYQSTMDLNPRMQLKWFLAGADKAFGANSFYTPKYPNQFEELRNCLLGLELKSKGRISTINRVHYRANIDRFELFREGMSVPSWYKNHNYHFTQVVHWSSQAWFVSKIGKTTLGVSLRNERINSNVLGLTQSDTMQALFDSEGFYTKFYERTFANIALEQSYQWKNFKISGGLSYFIFPNQKASNGIFPGVDLSYNYHKFRFFVGFNSGMRLPTFTDLFYQGPSNIGNPDLTPESQWVNELGTKYKNAILESSIRLFYANASNSIDWVRKADTLKWQPINVTKVYTSGFDFILAVNPSKSNLKAVAWIHRIGLQYSYINKVSKAPDYQSHYVMDYLKNKIVFDLQHVLYKSFSISYRVHYHDREGEYLFYNTETGKEVSQQYPSYWLADVRLNYENKNLLVYVDISNLFDVSYFDHGNIIQPGRWFSMGLKMKVNLRN